MYLLREQCVPNCSLWFQFFRDTRTTANTTWRKFWISSWKETLRIAWRHLVCNPLLYERWFLPKFGPKIMPSGMLFFLRSDWPWSFWLFTRPWRLVNVLVFLGMEVRVSLGPRYGFIASYYCFDLSCWLCIYFVFLYVCFCLGGGFPPRLERSSYKNRNKLNLPLKLIRLQPYTLPLKLGRA